MKSVKKIQEGYADVADLRRRAATLAPQAIETIAGIMNNEKASNADRMRAALALIERAYGKADAAGASQPPPPELITKIRERLQEFAASASAETDGDGACG